MANVRTRSGYTKSEPYPINGFPLSVIEELGKRLVYMKAVGRPDVDGNEFSRIFAESMVGFALNKPLGIADVTWNGCCWSVKTVKNAKPHVLTSRRGGTANPKRLRLIIGRNSPNYSAGVDNPMEDIQSTGNIVLEIQNSRIAETREHHADVRLMVFVRNMESREFTMFERSIIPFATNSYTWRLNAKGNLEGYEGDIHRFTWQPHGSQLTMVEPIPASATRFRIKKMPEALKMDNLLDVVGYEPSWIERI